MHKDHYRELRRRFPHRSHRRRAFSKLIPAWDIDVSKLADPSKQRMRELGLESVYTAV
jgi:hypothetical protein